MPLVGKVRIDNLVFGIKDKKHLLSTCFCCECCCISRFARHVPHEMRSELDLTGSIMCPMMSKFLQSREARAA